MLTVHGPGELVLRNDFGSTIVNIRINPNSGNLHVNISPVIFNNAAFTVTGMFAQVGEEWFPSGEFLDVKGLGANKLVKPTIRKAITEQVTTQVRNWWVTDQEAFQAAVLARWEYDHKQSLQALEAAERRYKERLAYEENEVKRYREGVEASLRRKPQFALESGDAGTVAAS